MPPLPQTLGQRTLSPGEDLRMLVEDKFCRVPSVQQLRRMTMHEVTGYPRELRAGGGKIQWQIDLSKNGLELESVSLTNSNQTSNEHFNPRTMPLTPKV
ncbi:hypothetical protein ACO2XV_06580 [Escherichia coli]